MPLGRNFVAVETSTTLCDALRLMTVKVPVPPLVPQAPVAVEPFTDNTMPNTDTGGKPGRAKIRTRSALSTPPDTGPCAPTISLTQTLANDGDVTSFMKNVVVGDTLTIAWDALRRSTVNVPDAPATPHAQI